MSVKIDLTGEKYGKLKVIGLASDEVGKKKKWSCVCECGNTVVVTGSNLRSGHTKQCEMCGYIASGKARVTHGMSNTPIYRVWRAMLSRCEMPNAKSYQDYGQRGICVCKEWHDASVFIEWANVNGYEAGMEIDRIDVNGDYCPENCRFTSRTENANNKRNNKIIEYCGESKTLAEWARHFAVSYKNLSRNLLKGYTLEEAVERQRSGERTHRGSKNWENNRK